jgi:transcriptional regulator with XRE-family HTH domain
MNERSIRRSSRPLHRTLRAPGATDIEREAPADRSFDRSFIRCKLRVEPASSSCDQTGPVPTRDRPGDRGARTAQMDISRLGSDIRSARVAAGLSLLRVAEVTGISGPQISRIERGLSPSTSVVQLVRLGAVVGLDVRIRAYPAGDPLRDAGQLHLIERFRKRLAPTIRVRLEVPLPIEGDRRAWDLFLDRLLG